MSASFDYRSWRLEGRNDNGRLAMRVSIKPNRATGGEMAEITMDESKLKQLLKSAIALVTSRAKRSIF
jgi:hypothetical protein